ncbi:MAG: BNR/Asp-box repeat-containing protein [Bacteroidetes bacterium]|nr:MAG: BNR/Asp-box repeat-containing protein [Bacteroidota bacterium]
MKNNIFLKCILFTLLVSFSSQEAIATKHIVNTQNFIFNPANLTGVFVGDTIRWVWINGIHTTTSTTIPLGAATWNSPISSSVTFFEYRVTVSGTYNYRCTPHVGIGMIGSFTAANPPSLSVTPSNQNVGPEAGNTSFAVTTTANWTAVSNQPWCTVTSSGSGNGTITAVFDQNNQPFFRFANITVSAPGASPVLVTVTQAQSTNKTLNLTLFLEGLFNGTGMNHAQNASGNQFAGNTADQVTVELRNATPPYSLAGGPFLANAGNTGATSLIFTGLPDNNYYIVVKHRNSIETWSNSPVLFISPLINYDFTSSASQAFGGNLKPVSGKYVIFGGDVNQDGQVDSGDMTPVDNDAGNFTSGYIASDANGDGTIDTADVTILDNNSAEFVGAVTP